MIGRLTLAVLEIWVSWPIAAAAPKKEAQPEIFGGHYCVSFKLHGGVFQGFV